MEAEICACVSRLAATLKPEYAEALEAIGVGSTPVKAYAEAKGLSANNAAVRVFVHAKRSRSASLSRAEPVPNRDAWTVRARGGSYVHALFSSPS